VLSLVDFSILTKTWTYSKPDFVAVAATILLTWASAWSRRGLGRPVGGLHLYKTSRPHVAEVGLVPGTQHFRNILRHKVETDPAMVTLRVDESLYFVNARFLEDLMQERVSRRAAAIRKHVVLMCSAVNEVDFSALESLEAINSRLKDIGVGLHLSEVKGPVMDRLRHHTASHRCRSQASRNRGRLVVSAREHILQTVPELMRIGCPRHRPL
jgi:SulP family sulfate permease